MSSDAKFCTSCDNLLEKAFINNELLFVCENCQKRELASPSDTLCKERIKGTDVISIKSLERAVYDDTVITARIRCAKDKCMNDIVKQVRMNGYNALYNICTECKTIWLAN